MNDLQRITISAAVDLDARSLPVTAQSVARRVVDYHAGSAMFPLLSAVEAQRVLDDVDDGMQGMGLFGIGKKIKKILKKVEDTVKPVLAPIAAGVANVFVPGSGPVVYSALSSYRKAVAEGKSAAEQQKAYDEYAAQAAAGQSVPLDPQAAALIPPGVSIGDPTVAGIPQQYLPFVVGGGLLALYLVMRR